MIKNLYASKKPVISFEIFPPKRDGSVDSIYDTIEKLKGLEPDYISVTYGAGGSTQDKTAEISSIIQNKFGIETLAHLTCVGLSENKLNSFIDELSVNNVHNIMALRGDLPKDYIASQDAVASFSYASDLIDSIKKHHSISIGAACYPEGHFESHSLEADIENLKIKVDQGVDFLVTQLFFDNELFYKFMDLIRKKGIDIPVSAGIMPVTNHKQIERIITLSGASLPAKFSRMLAKYEHNPEALREAGIAYATDQIIDLLSWGIDGIHIYTMNRPETCIAIVDNIRHIIDALKHNDGFSS